MLYIKEYNEDRIEKLKFIDTEIHRLMNLIFTMTEEEEKDLLRMKISELMDERDALRDKEGNLPPSTIQKAQPIKDTGFSEILPPLPVSNTYKSYYGYGYKRSRKQLLDDTPLFESRKSTALYLNKEIEKNKIEELSEYLQETFDNNQISHDSDNEDQCANKKNSWRINYSHIYGNSHIKITIDTNLFNKVVSEIYEKIPLLKRRINADIKINSFENKYFPSSTIIINIDTKEKRKFYHQKKKSRIETNLKRRNQ